MLWFFQDSYQWISDDAMGILRADLLSTTQVHVGCTDVFEVR
ncbi:hypothetical protein AF72_02365 [Xylella taiwanensis]|uniref:Uncharacterized protein n=1 Tax=Xylella taiwanensis TaxID=1444770 RepID=Z9JMX3_9GAMM|nr:hypothetical protein AF72_02365 [Xylella taiwanensis]